MELFLNLAWQIFTDQVPRPVSWEAWEVWEAFPHVMNAWLLLSALRIIAHIQKLGSSSANLLVYNAVNRENKSLSRPDSVPELGRCRCRDISLS